MMCRSSSSRTTDARRVPFRAFQDLQPADSAETRIAGEGRRVRERLWSAESPCCTSSRAEHRSWRVVSAKQFYRAAARSLIASDRCLEKIDRSTAWL